MIIPTILIEQSLRPEQRQITTVQRRGAMLQVRGELCPLIQLRALFGYGTAIDPCSNLAVIVQSEGQKIALVVDELIGQQQVVIKTLGERFKQVLGVSGAAILGDGRVGLILEPTGLLALYNRQRSTTYCQAGPPADGGPAEPLRGAEPNDGSPLSSIPARETSSEDSAACPAELVAAPA
jgi:chemotaxis protein histidine kinase CheA